MEFVVPEKLEETKAKAKDLWIFEMPISLKEPRVHNYWNEWYIFYNGFIEILVKIKCFLLKNLAMMSLVVEEVTYFLNVLSHFLQ